MKIFDIEEFPNPVRVRIALAEKGASGQVQFIPVDVMGGEHRTAAFAAKIRIRLCLMLNLNAELACRKRSDY